MLHHRLSVASGERPLHWKQRVPTWARMIRDNRSPWPEADRAYAHYLRLKGFRAAEIGEKIGRTADAVRLQLAKLALEERQHVERLRFLQKLHARGEGGGAS